MWTAHKQFHFDGHQGHFLVYQKNPFEPWREKRDFLRGSRHDFLRTQSAGTMRRLWPMDRTLRYPREREMPSFEGYEGRENRVAENVGLMRGGSSHFDSSRPVEADSHKTLGFSGRKSCVTKRTG